MFLHKLLSLDNSCIANCIFIRRYLKYRLSPNSVKNGFIPDICRILLKYGLSSILSEYFNGNTLPSKLVWKIKVSKAIRENEYLLWQLRMSRDNDFDRFKKVHLSIHSSTLWPNAISTPSLNLSHFVAKLLIKPPNKDNGFSLLCNSDYICRQN